MNILQRVLHLKAGAADLEMPWLPAVVREVSTTVNSVQGIAKVAGRVRVPAEAMLAVRVTGVERPHLKRLLAEPCSHPLPGGLILVRKAIVF